MRLLCLALVAYSGMLAGCVSVGPNTVPRDRLDYSEAVTESWKRQNLLNIVKLRYGDPPVFVDVGQIVSGYTIETGMNIGGQVSSNRAVQGNSMTLGGSGKYTDRPTITYIPMTGSKFVSGLIMPIPPDALFFAIQSGWPADLILNLGVGAINGLRNGDTALDRRGDPDPRFVQAAELLRQIQQSGSVSIRVRKGPNNDTSTVMTFHSLDTQPETLAQIRELRSLLGLSQQASEFTLVFGDHASHDREIAVRSRAMLHVMGTLAQRVEVPEQDVQEGRVSPGLSTANRAAPGTFGIHCSDTEPADAFASIHYRNRWFWVDDRDMRSKRSFSLIMLLFTLSDVGSERTLPLLTIPTG